MTQQLERMIAVLEANVSKFDKVITASTGLAIDEFGQVVRAGDAMEAKLGGLGPKAGRGLNAVGKAAQGAKVQTSNLAAQFNDIGVQLAGGQSPFLIALQQGSQINQALGGGGLKATVQALGGAFMSLVNPISLATIAAIALGGTAIQYFSDLISGGADSEETLKKQAELIQAVADKWGAALPALQKYLETEKVLQEQTDLNTAINEKSKAQYASVAAEMLNLNVERAAAMQQLQEINGMDEAGKVHAAEEAYAELQKKIADGTASYQDNKKYQDALIAAMDGAVNGPLKTYIEMLQLMKTIMDAASGAAKRLRADLPGGGFIGPMQPNPLMPKIGTVPTPENRPLVELEGFPEVPKAKKEQQNQFESATQSLEDRTKALEAQRAAQASVNPLVEDYGFALEQAKAKADLLAAAEKAKIELTPEIIASIDQLSTAYAKASADMAKLAETQKLAAEAVAFQKSLLSGALDDMRSALEDGKLEWEDLGNIAANVLNKIADKLQSMLIDQLFSAVAPSGGGISSILSLIGLGGAAAAGGLSGGSGGATAASAGAAASTVASAPATPSAASMGAAQKVQTEVAAEVYVKDDGNFDARIVKVSSASGQAGLDHYRRNQMRVDVNRIASTRRVRGSI